MAPELQIGSNPKNLIFSKRFSDEKVGEVGIRKEPDYKIGPVSVNMLVHSNRITKKKKEAQAGVNASGAQTKKKDDDVIDAEVEESK